MQSLLQNQVGMVSSTLQIQSQHFLQQISHLKMAQDLATAVSNMCVECGCGMDTVGSGMGDTKIPGGMLDTSRDGEAGLTLNMTATQQERLRFINE
jgi:hypothetical protein